MRAITALAEVWDTEIDFVHLDIDDPDTETSKRELGYRTKPNHTLLDADENVLQRWLGFVRAEVLEQAFREAINID